MSSLATLLVGVFFSVSTTFTSLGDLYGPGQQLYYDSIKDRKTMYVNEDNTPVYAQPDESSEVKSLAPTNCTFEVVEQREHWSIISTCDGYAFVKTEKLQDTPARQIRSLGKFRLTYYCPHACCGTGNGVTASGRKATVGRTIAISKKWLPLGTHVLINDHEYVVDDRGVTGNTIDILVSTHKEARKRGVNYAEVFVIE